LLKAVIERSKKLAEEENVSDQDFQQREEEEGGSENMLDSFHPMKRKTPRDELASSDEEEYASYEKKFQDHTAQQLKKLRAAGISIDGLILENMGNAKKEKFIGRTEELTKEIDGINKSVSQKVRSKQRSEMEIEEKAKAEEQQRRLKAKQAQNQEFARAVKALTLGVTFLKYGAIG